MRTPKVLFVACFIFSSSLFAQENIDLRPEFGPIRQQGYLGFCNAYAAADLLSYWLNNSAGFKNTKKDTREKENMVSGLAYALWYNFKHEPPASLKEKTNLVPLRKKVSEARKKLDEVTKEIYNSDPTAATIKNKIESWQGENSSVQQLMDLQSQLETLLHSNQKYIEATSDYNIAKNDLFNATYGKNSSLSYRINLDEEGSGEFAKEDLSNMSICFEKEVNSEGVIFKKEEPETVIYSTKDVILDLQDSCAYMARQKKEKNSVYTTSSSLPNETIKTMFPNIRERVIKRITDQSNKMFYIEPISYLLKKSCPLNRKLGKRAPIVTSYSVDSGVELINWIDKQLENKKPIYIVYNPDVFSFSGVELPSSNLGPHAAVVVGRLKSPNVSKIEYIIRNSNGLGGCEYIYANYYGLTEKQEQALVKEMQEKIDKNCSCTEGSEYDKSCVQKYADETNERRKDLGSKAVRPYRCENGYYIIEKEAFEPVLSAVAWLEDPQKQ